MPDLTPDEDNEYIALNDLEIGQIPRFHSRRDDLISPLWGRVTTPLYFYKGNEESSSDKHVSTGECFI